MWEQGVGSAVGGVQVWEQRVCVVPVWSVGLAVGGGAWGRGVWGMGALGPGESNLRVAPPTPAAGTRG
jgi:hypothetical protein